MRFKLHPTPSANGICVTCSHGQVMAFEHGEDMTVCNYLMTPYRIRRPVLQCTSYTDRTHDDESEMRKIAWIIRTDKRGQLGFQAPKKKTDD